MSIIEKVREEFMPIFVNGDSADMEFFGSLITTGATITTLWLGNAGHDWFFYILLIFSVLQGIATFTTLKARHITNIIITLLTFTTSYLLYTVHGISDSGVGGYFGVGIMSLYCAFKTRLHMLAGELKQD